MPSRALTSDEIKRINDSLTCVRDRCLFLLGVYTGFRISELLSLMITDVMLNNYVLDAVTVRRCNMKGKHSSRTIPLHNEVKLILKDYLGDLSTISDKQGDLSTMRNTRLFPFTRMQAHRILSKAIALAGIKGSVSTHSMRKTFGMRVYAATKFNIVAAQRALGHKSLSSTTHYLNVDQDVIDAAILGEEKC